MSEFYIKSAEFVKTGVLEQTVRVTVSSFKGRSDVELAAEYDGAVIGGKKINLAIGENITDLLIAKPDEARKIILKLYYRGFATNYYEADISPEKS